MNVNQVGSRPPSEIAFRDPPEPTQNKSSERHARIDRLYQKMKSHWSKISRGIAASRKIMQIALKKLDPRSAHFGKIQLAIRSTKLFSAISIPFNIESFLSGCVHLHKKRKEGDREGVKLGVLDQITNGLVVIDAVESLVEGIASFLPAAASLENILQITSLPMPFIALSINGCGIAGRSYKIDRERRVLKQVKELEKNIDNPDLFLPLLQSMIGITEGEEEKIARKVDSISNKKLKNVDPEKRQEAEELARKKLRTRMITAKKRSIERATSGKAVALLKQMQKERQALSPETEKEIFKEMRKVIHRKIAFQSVGIVRNLISIGGTTLAFTPIGPIAPLVISATSLVWSIIMDLVEEPLVYRGLQQIHPRK